MGTPQRKHPSGTTFRRVLYHPMNRAVTSIGGRPVSGSGTRVASTRIFRLLIIVIRVNHSLYPQLPQREAEGMNAPPKGWPRISAAVFYDDAARAIAWLCEAFGFEVRLKVEGEGGRIEHSELTFGEGLIMVGSSGGRSDRPVPFPCRSPRSLGGANTQTLCICVDDVDAHCERARAAGAKIVEAPRNAGLRRGLLERPHLPGRRP